MVHRAIALEPLIQQARSKDPQERSIALQELYVWADKNPASHAQLLPLFREIVADGDGSWATVSAVRGIDHIVGGEEARQAWLKVLTHSDPQVAALAASFVGDRSFALVLLELLANRSESVVRNAVISALGRLECEEALPPLIDALAIEETRWDAIYALTNLGDPRAIPYLEPFLEDQSKLRGVDDRGCEITVRDITGEAIRRLQYLAGKLPPPVRLALADPPSNEAVPPLPLLPPLPLHNASIPPWAPSSQKPATRPHNLLAYLPLVAAVVEVPWLFIVSDAMRAHAGVRTMEENKANIHQQDLVAAIPVGLGLLIGLTLLIRGTVRRLPEQISIYLGGILCGAFLWALGKEFFN